MAYTIVDYKKIREQSHTLHKIKLQNARNNLIAEKRNFTENNKSEKIEKEFSTQSSSQEEIDFVIDVYFRDKNAKQEEIDKLNRIKLEPFDENLQLENEYERESYDSEDSNGLEIL